MTSSDQTFSSCREAEQSGMRSDDGTTTDPSGIIRVGSVLQRTVTLISGSVALLMSKCHFYTNNVTSWIWVTWVNVVIFSAILSSNQPSGCCASKNYLEQQKCIFETSVLRRTEGMSLLLSAEHLQQEAVSERAELLFRLLKNDLVKETLMYQLVGF